MFSENLRFHKETVCRGQHVCCPLSCYCKFTWSHAWIPDVFKFRTRTRKFSGLGNSGLDGCKLLHNLCCHLNYWENLQTSKPQLTCILWASLDSQTAKDKEEYKTGCLLITENWQSVMKDTCFINKWDNRYNESWIVGFQSSVSTNVVHNLYHQHHLEASVEMQASGPTAVPLKQSLGAGKQEVDNLSRGFSYILKF